MTDKALTISRLKGHSCLNCLAVRSCIAETMQGAENLLKSYKCEAIILSSDSSNLTLNISAPAKGICDNYIEGFR